jgi:hypothetical protein
MRIGVAILAGYFSDYFNLFPVLEWGMQSSPPPAEEEAIAATICTDRLAQNGQMVPPCAEFAFSKKTAAGQISKKGKAQGGWKEEGENGCKNNHGADYRGCSKQRRRQAVVVVTLRVESRWNGHGF